MVVGMEYSDLPEVVPAPSTPAVSQYHPSPYLGGGTTQSTPIVSPITPETTGASIAGRRRPKPPTPWSPNSLGSLNPGLSGLHPPGTFSGNGGGGGPPPCSEPPSPAPSSQVSHLPLHHPTTPSLSHSSPYITMPSHTSGVPPGSGPGVMGPPHPGPGPGVGMHLGLGPVAAARQRRRKRMMIGVGACVGVLLVIIAGVAGIAFGVIHVKIKNNNNDVTPPRSVVPRGDDPAIPIPITASALALLMAAVAGAGGGGAVS
jgi:hypothetical protein